MKVVIDANTLAAGAIIREPISIINKIVDAWSNAKAFELILSKHTVTEVKNTLKDLYFADRLKSYQIGSYIALLRRRGTLITVKTHVRGVATHIQDDEVIATAIDGGAQIFVTRDSGLLSVEAYQGIQIIDPYQFFHLVRRSL